MDKKLTGKSTIDDLLKQAANIGRYQGGPVEIEIALASHNLRLRLEPVAADGVPIEPVMWRPDPGNTMPLDEYTTAIIWIGNRATIYTKHNGQVLVLLAPPLPESGAAN